MNLACCCDDCLLIHDDFGNGFISEWTQQTGSWSESGGELSAGGSAGVITHDISAAGENHIVSAVIKFAAIGDRARVFGNYSGISSYIYAEVEILTAAFAALRIGDASAGDFSEVTFGFSGGLPAVGTLVLCIGAESTVGYFGSTRLVYQEAATPGGNQAGLEVVSGSPTFQDFFFHEEDCFPCTATTACDCCLNGEAGLVKLTISGFSGGVGACGCGDLNGTWIIQLPAGGSYNCAFGNGCGWTWTKDNTSGQGEWALTDSFSACGRTYPCDTNSLPLGIGPYARPGIGLYYANGEYVLQCWLIETQTNSMVFRLKTSEKPACRTWDDTELPFYGRYDGFTAEPDWPTVSGCCTVGTVTITSL